MAPAGRTLALGYDLRHLGGGLRFSVARFHTDLVRAILRRRAFERLLLVARPFAPQRGAARFADRPTVRALLGARPRGVRVELSDYPSLVGPGAPRPDVFHEGSWQDLIRPFRLRALSPGARFPITVAHHGLSPLATLRDFGFDLLFCPSRPCDAIVSTSRAALAVVRAHLDEAREALARAHGAPLRFRGRFAVIPPGVDPSLYRPRPKRPLRRRFGLPEEALVLLFFGRFELGGKADLLPLLRVFRAVVDDHPGADVILVIAGAEGHPSEEAIVRAYAAELGLAARVKRISAVPPEDDPFLFAAADVCVCPSDGPFENFGLSVVQAMAAGVPVVASDWDGHRDTVVHGETGFLVPTLWGPCDPWLSRRLSFLDASSSTPPLVEATAIDGRAFREMLGALVGDAARRREMGRRARERARACFTVDGAAARYEELWAELGAVARKGPARPRREKDLLDASLLRLYRAQVSEVLDGESRVVLSRAGRRVLEGAEPVPVSGVEPSFVERASAFRILASLASARGASGRAAGALVRAAGRAARREPEAVWCDLLWLLKYGYVERAGPRVDTLERT